MPALRSVDGRIGQAALHRVAHGSRAPVGEQLVSEQQLAVRRAQPRIAPGRALPDSRVVADKGPIPGTLLPNGRPARAFMVTSFTEYTDSATLALALGEAIAATPIPGQRAAVGTTA